VDTLPIIGFEVASVVLDSSVDILFGLDHSTSLRIESDFRMTNLVTGIATRVHFAPYENDPATPTGLTEVALLLRRTIETAIYENNGALRIEFSDGLELSVDPPHDFEAWTLAGPGFFYVGTPGAEGS
jgi:hypothetical protein